MPDSDEPLRCVIVDDSTVFLEAARATLERQGVTVLAVATNISDAVRAVAALSPDVTVVDVYLGDENGFALAELISDGTSGATAAVVMTSSHDCEDFAERLVSSAALGFVSKLDISADAIRAVLRARS